MSTRQMSNDNAAPASVAVTHRYKYDAFGVGLEASRASGEFVNAYRYTGEQYDGALGNYYLRARYYAQRQGRFLNRDTFVGIAREPVSLHKYIYANANPINRIDPSGHFSLAETLI
jgi:RHS repeat-associated protein